MVTKRRSRGSQRMASISHSMPVLADLEPSKPMEMVCTVSIASSRVDKEAAFGLAYRNYLQQGYIQENTSELLVNDYDAHESTRVLIVKDQALKVIASVTLVFGAHTRIPSANTFDYGDMDIDVAHTVELSRIVVEAGIKKDGIVFHKLVARAFLCAQHASSSEGCIICEVNPKHVIYYTKMFAFEVLADEVPCLMVGNAPAVLIKLPFSVIKAATSTPGANIFCDEFLNIYQNESYIDDSHM